MLFLNYYNFFFKKNIKSGLFIDYIVRATSLNFIKNNFIWGGLFILEKFFIEYLSKGIFNKLYLFFYKKSSKNLFDLTLIFYIILLSSLLIVL